MFDLDIKVSSNEYFDLIHKLECLTSENEHLKGLNKNQMNTIIDMRNEITDLKRQNGDLCELVGKTKKERKDYEAMQNELRAGANESSAEIHDLKRALKSAEDDILEYRKANYALRKQLESHCETCDVPDNCVNASEAVLKDADAKIQSANDKAANAKKEAKQAKETAERYREENFVLHTQINQFKKLNDELIKELARQQNAELIMKFDRKGED